MPTESDAASSSTPPDTHHHRHPNHRFQPPQSISDRIVRALRHRLRLLYRSESAFFILGATGNVYTVNLTATPSCTCPDRTTPCKHILFVLIRVLGISLDDACLRRRTLRPCQLHRLLGTPTLQEAVAGPGLRERFHQLFFGGGQEIMGGDKNSKRPMIEIEDGTMCPVCLEEMEKEERVVRCGTCRNLIHEECLVRWKRSRGRRGGSCVICRARWRTEQQQQDLYLNLSAYISLDDHDDDDEMMPQTDPCSG